MAALCPQPVLAVSRRRRMKYDNRCTLQPPTKPRQRMLRCEENCSTEVEEEQEPDFVESV